MADRTGGTTAEKAGLDTVRLGNPDRTEDGPWTGEGQNPTR